MITIFDAQLAPALKAGTASLAGVLLTYPIDTALRQKQAGKKVNFLNTLKYRGFIPSAANLALSRSLAFNYVEKFKADSRYSSTQAILLGSGIVGAIKPFILYPIDLIKIQFQTQTASTYSQAKTNILALPVRHHIRAINFMQARGIVGFSTWFLTQEQFNSLIDIQSPHLKHMITGGLSSVCISVMIQPFEVGKIINQTGNFQPLFTLLKTHGISRFYTSSIFCYSISKNVVNGAVFNTIYSAFNYSS